ncbi:MAG: tetratricopeptide repeat protein [Pyrinomonadaceae bacterium]
MTRCNNTSIGVWLKMVRGTLLFFTALFSINAVYAQPGPLEHGLQRTAQEIAALDNLISRSSLNSELYLKRARLYLSWYEHYGAQVEYKGVVYATDPGGKALADIERAIELDPHSEAFTLRGRYYEANFRHQKPANLDSKMVDWNEVAQYYWQNDSFKSAVADYHKGLQSARSPKEKADALYRLGWLYRSRALAFSDYSPANYLAKLVRAERKTNLVFEDFDKSLAFMKMHIDAIGSKYGGASDIRDTYQDKARAAALFEDRAEGLRTLTAGINALKGVEWEEELVYRLYVLRGELHFRAGDFSSALRDYNYPIERNYANSVNVYEKRGDVYAATGKLEFAIRDYTQEISKPNSYPQDRLFLKRGRVYLALGDVEKAVADLSHVLRYGSACPEPRSLRAKAYRLLHKESLAEEDEKIAKSIYARNRSACGLLYQEF